MDILDMSVTTSKGNRYVLVMVDCFSRWTEAFPLPNKTALAVSDAFFSVDRPSFVHQIISAYMTTMFSTRFFSESV